jgi:DNA replication protein DnaC
MRTNRRKIRDEISTMCKKMSFSQSIVTLCENEANAREESFLHLALRKEIENRIESRKARLLKEAGFPVYKTLKGYDFKDVKLPPQLKTSDLSNCSFIRQKQNIVLFGPVGTGKTHLASALGVAACAMDIPVRFYTVAELVVRLSEALRSCTIDRMMKSILKADLIILDEWGYVPVDKQGAQWLFRIIADSYERRSLVITTNLEFSKWGTVLTDDQMAAAIIDRIAHYGHLVLFDGDSHRMRNALMKHK